MNERVPVDVERGTLRGRSFYLVRWLLMGFLKALVGLRVEGSERVPREGPLLVVCNHVHNADPVLISVGFPRPLHFMAKKELFSVPVIGPVIRRVGAFPVDRGKPDRGAIRRAEAVLRAAIAVGMFPEGTRSLSGGLALPFPGAGLLALRSEAPIVPVVIMGSERLPFNGAKGRRSGGTKRRGVLIKIGEPFTILREEEGAKITAEVASSRMMAELAALLPRQYQGVFAPRDVTSGPG
ncbi:MAG: 1-acyl-sn-glycerol-3-phosphate acyltransferase [Chloroflexota bacterium]|nr:1-acyl-sn-glycerol-3-phosphate acyltransferase [Chloroflexota bacterium]